MTELAALKARILANPEARADYEAHAPEFELAREFIAARTRAGLGATFPRASISGARLAIRIRLWAKAKTKTTHLTLTSPRTRNCCSPRLRLWALTHSAVAARFL